MKKYTCPYCGYRTDRTGMISHLDKQHYEALPEGFSPARMAFKIVNGKDHGTCVVCKRETNWNEKNGKYDRLCGREECKKKLRDAYKNNMLRVRGTYNILNDPEQQEKMLKNRRISGKYRFQDGGYHIYTGSYEKKCLEFLDQVMQFKSSEILSPGPVFEYEYKGKMLKWITDILIIPFNLIIEVKDGGDNPNNRAMPDYRAKQDAKESMITDMGKFNYLRLTNNNFGQLLSTLAELKAQLIDDNEENKKVIININEAAGVTSNGYSDAKRVYDSLSDEDKKFISPNGRFVDSPNIAYRYIHKIGKDVAGFIDCYKYNGTSTTSVYIVYAVTSKFRGRGISRILLDKAVKSCREKGYNKIIYKCDSKNENSAKAAEAYGFKLTKSSKNQKSYELLLNNKSMISESSATENSLASIIKIINGTLMMACMDLPESVRKQLINKKTLLYPDTKAMRLSFRRGEDTEVLRLKSFPYQKGAGSSKKFLDAAAGSVNFRKKGYAKARVETKEGFNIIYVKKLRIKKNEDTDLLQEERVYNESIPDFDDPIALHKYLNTFEYGMLDSDLNKTNSSSSYRTISPTNFFKYKIGTCWDFVAAEAYYFRKAFANYKITSQDLKDNTYSLYFIQKDDSSKQTHTWLAYMKQNKVTVIESAWGKMMGVHTFSSEEEMISKYIESFVSGSQKYILYKYHPVGKYGLKPDEYLDYIYEHAKEIRNTFNEEYTFTSSKFDFLNE